MPAVAVAAGAQSTTPDRAFNMKSTSGVNSPRLDSNQLSCLLKPRPFQYHAPPRVYRLHIPCPTLHMPPPSALSVPHIKSGLCRHIFVPVPSRMSCSCPRPYHSAWQTMTCGRTLIDILALIDAATSAIQVPCRVSRNSNR